MGCTGLLIGILILAYKMHPGRLTWNLRRHPWKRKIIFQTIISRFYVNLPRCIFCITQPTGLFSRHGGNHETKPCFSGRWRRSYRPKRWWLQTMPKWRPEAKWRETWYPLKPSNVGLRICKLHGALWRWYGCFLKWWYPQSPPQNDQF